MAIPRSKSKRRRRCWLIASTSTKYVTVRSKVNWFRGHWKGGAQRCPGPELCTICASGADLRTFTYIFVEEQGGEVMVFEIPERLHDLAEELEDAVGTQLSIVRDGFAKNSPILIGVVGRVDCDELDLLPFMRTLGNRDLDLVENPNQSESFSPPEGATRSP